MTFKKLFIALFHFTLLFYYLTEETAYAKVYKFVDEYGVIHFSDFYDQDLTKNAEQISLQKNLQVFNADSKKSKLNNDFHIPNSSHSEKIESSILIKYPQDQQVVQFDAKGLQVEFAIQSELQNGDQIICLLDDKIVAKVTDPHASRCVISNLTRGEHSLLVKVMTNSGVENAVSKKETFFVHQTSISNS